MSALDGGCDARLFFRHAAVSGLTGEQLRVLCLLLANEADGAITIFQKEVAEELELAESNVSRAIKALTEAELITPYPGELWRGGGVKQGGKFVKGVYFKVNRKFLR